MNATRKFAKKTSSIFQYSYEKTKTSFASNITQGVLILLLIVYSAVLVKFLPHNFLAFFDNLIVKIVVLVIIAFVGIYSPAVALFIAIALICTLQMSQKKRLLDDVRNLLPSVDKKDILAGMRNLKQDILGAAGVVESMEDGQLDPSIMAQDSEVDQHIMMNEQFANEMIDQIQEDEVQVQDVQENYNHGDANKDSEPVGFNNDASCISCNGDNNNSSNAQCGYVQTWKNQFSAQGLGSEIVGFQKSFGYPV